LPSLTVIIPAYNEEKSLQQFLPEVITFCKQKNYKLIVVNDGSKDETAKILAGYSNENTLKVLHNKLNAGYGASLKKGVREADTDFVVTIDADGQHSLTDIDKLLQHAIDTDADMVVGNRGNSSGYYRGLGKWFIRRIANFLMPLPVHDLNSGMKLYDTSLAKKYISICPETMAYSDIILLAFVFKKHLVTEVPITIKPRTQGKSTINTMTAIDTLKEIMNIVLLFNPVRIFFPAGLLCIVASLLWNIHIFMDGKGLSTGSLLGILTGFILFFFGLIAHQLSATRRAALE
jgi:glycosyltransferase involved in cell wall biosynthesis